MAITNILQLSHLKYNFFSFQTTSHFKNVIESSVLTGNNIYLLAFASVAMIVTAIITIIRHRQQKFAAEQKEMEYLRYFHSVLPHSQIYGNLNEKFSKLDKRKNSRNGHRNSKRRKTDKVDDISDTENKLNGLTSIYKQFRYSQYSSKTLSKDADDDHDEGNELDETEMIDFGFKQSSTINQNGQVTSIAADINDANTEQICQKYHFTVDTDSMQDVVVQVEDTHKETELADIRNDEKVAQKWKTESANHRVVHFCLENDEQKQEQEVAVNSFTDSAGTQPQEELRASNRAKNIDELIIQKMLTESIKNMKVTEL